MVHEARFKSESGYGLFVNAQCIRS